MRSESTLWYIKKQGTYYLSKFSSTKHLLLSVYAEYNYYRVVKLQKEMCRRMSYSLAENRFSKMFT